MAPGFHPASWGFQCLTSGSRDLQPSGHRGGFQNPLGRYATFPTEGPWSAHPPTPTPTSFARPRGPNWAQLGLLCSQRGTERRPSSVLQTLAENKTNTPKQPIVKDKGHHSPLGNGQQQMFTCVYIPPPFFHYSPVHPSVHPSILPIFILRLTLSWGYSSESRCHPCPASLTPKPCPSAKPAPDICKAWGKSTNGRPWPPGHPFSPQVRM